MSIFLQGIFCNMCLAFCILLTSMDLFWRERCESKEEKEQEEVLELLRNDISCEIGF